MHQYKEDITTSETEFGNDYSVLDNPADVVVVVVVVDVTVVLPWLLTVAMYTCVCQISYLV